MYICNVNFKNNNNMPAVLEKPKINNMLANLKSKKHFDSDRFAGAIVWNEEPVAYQKRLRNEWE